MSCEGWQDIPTVYVSGGLVQQSSGLVSHFWVSSPSPQYLSTIEFGWQASPCADRCEGNFSPPGAGYVDVPLSGTGTRVADDATFFIGVRCYRGDAEPTYAGASINVPPGTHSVFVNPNPAATGDVVKIAVTGTGVGDCRLLVEDADGVLLDEQDISLAPTGAVVYEDPFDGGVPPTDGGILGDAIYFVVARLSQIHVAATCSDVSGPFTVHEYVPVIGP